MMNIRYIFTAGMAMVLIGPVWLAGDDPKTQPPPQTVSEVALERYVGLWYEIAKIPNRFQRQCVGQTTAAYRIRPDGQIDVVNRCLTQDGTFTEARGIARIVDPLTNARLQVSFVRLFGRSLFWGDYWIIGLDPDYRWAVVGTPSRRYGWILAREPDLDTHTWDEIQRLLIRQGYDPTRFVRTPQASPTP